MKKIEVLGLETIPEIKTDDNLAQILIDCAAKETGGFREKDIVVITSKIVSKALGLLRNIEDIKPGKNALSLSRKTGKDPKLLQMMSDAGHEIIVMIPMDGLIKEQVIRSCKNRRVAEELCRQEGVMCVTRDKTGRIYTHDGGIDQSNFPEGTAGYLPSDPDAVAMDIGHTIRKQTSLNVAVIIADTEIVLPGTMDISIGTWGISPQAKLFGQADGFGKAKFGGMDLVTYEIASACALVFGQTAANIPAAIVRGYEYEFNQQENVGNTLVPQATDAQMRKTIKSIMRATALVKGFKEKMLLKIASWFI